MARLSRRNFLGGMGVGLAGAATGCKTYLKRSTAKQPPNILLLLTDDQRWDTMGCMGNPVIQTPHLDHLATEGVIFDNCFATTPVCCVSRASIFSGQYARYHGVADLVKMSDPGPWEQTYPGLLKRAGYTIGYIGKYNLFTPSDIDREALRYDFWAGWQYHGNYWHDRGCPNLTSNGIDKKTDNHCTCPPQGELPRVGHAGIEHPIHTTTEMIPQQVQKFLETRDPKVPFCLTVGTKAPKDPWDDFPDTLGGLYRGVDMPIPATATPETAASLPEFLRRSLASDSGLRYCKHHDDLAERIRCYFRCITALDDSIGQIRSMLAEHGVADNTVILFVSDNGHFLADHGLWGKWLGYEPSIRVPGIIYDPRAPAHRRGKRRSEMILNIDIAPTMLSLAAVPVPCAMQGSDLTSLLEGKPVDWRKDWFFEHTWTAEGKIEPSEGIRTERWKYLRYNQQDPVFEQLFDLESDPLETNNLVGHGAPPTILDYLRHRWETLRETLAGQPASQSVNGGNLRSAERVLFLDSGSIIRT